MSTLKNRIIEFIEERKSRIENGSINCIPFPFPRFRNSLYGIEQGQYYLISGSTKSGKTQLTNFMFLYNTILFSYYNKGKISAKIFYFPLEETAETITLRFASFLLYTLTNGNIRMSSTDLRSINPKRVVSDEIISFMKTNEKFNDIMNFFEDIVTFYDDRNPTGIFKMMKQYATGHGTTHMKKINVKTENGTIERDIFDYYVPDNIEEYVMVIVDHTSLIETEKGLTLRESINRLSEYMIILRNRYNYIPIIVQQQSMEIQTLAAVKEGKVRPTVAGLSDSKYTARDCNVMLGITNPHVYEFESYKGYDIYNTFRGNARFMEVVINRSGVANGLCPLFFDGAVNYFEELPLPTDIEGIDKIARKIRR